MAKSQPIKRLQFDQIIIDVLQRNGIITCQQLISRNYLELLKITNASFKTVQDIVGLASKACCPQPTTALDLWSLRQGQKRYLQTSLPTLDNFLKGGLPAGTLTEIAGPPGCGKTQMCIMLSAIAGSPIQHGGFETGVLYIDTESAFSPERLFEIARMNFSDYYNDNDDNLISLGQRVHVSVVTTVASLFKRLENIEEDLIRKNIGLVVIDSIASLIRKELDTQVRGNIVERTNLLSKQAATLKYIGETLQIPIVVTNQITTHFRPTLSSAMSHQMVIPEDNPGVTTLGDESESYVTVALGTTWSHHVNTRLILQYQKHCPDIRQIMIAKSPVSGFQLVNFHITSKGLEEKVDVDVCSDQVTGTDPSLQKIIVRSCLDSNNITI